MFTGGTIGSKKQCAEIDVRDAGSYVLLDAYQAAYDSSVVFTPIQPLNILSEDLTPEHWNVIIKMMAKQDLSQYDGVIITHGSDTLAYSAGVLGLFMQHLQLPVMLVASNYPIDDERANGVRNFAAAVDLIKQKVPNNIFVVYENDKQKMLCYLATRISQCEPFTDQFSSPYELVLGEVIDGKLHYYDHPLNPTEQQLNNRVPIGFPSAILEGTFSFNRILYIKPYTGLDYRWISWTEQTKPVAIVHDLYHSGTACTSEREHQSLISLVKRAKADHIPVYLTPIRSLEEAIYASTVELADLGVNKVSGLNVEATLAKVHLASLLFPNNIELQVKFVQEQNINFEQHK